MADAFNAELWQGGATIDDARSLIAKRAAMSCPYRSLGDDHLTAGVVKLWTDGGGGARTAWMYEDWNVDVAGTDTGNRGYPSIEPDTLGQNDRGIPRRRDAEAQQTWSSSAAHG